MNLNFWYKILSLNYNSNYLKSMNRFGDIGINAILTEIEKLTKLSILNLNFKYIHALIIIRFIFGLSF